MRFRPWCNKHKHRSSMNRFAT